MAESELWFRNVQGADDVLSNFYMTDITVRGKMYKSAEHAYQALKAAHHRNYELKKAIEDAESAVEAKRLSKQVEADKNWIGKRATLIKEVIEEKAVQCNIFRETLMETGDRKLLHTVEDLYWGTGLPGENGKNVFGELLMEVRRDLLRGELKSKSQRLGNQQKNMRHQRSRNLACNARFNVERPGSKKE